MPRISLLGGRRQREHSATLTPVGAPAKNTVACTFDGAPIEIALAFGLLAVTSSVKDTGPQPVDRVVITPGGCARPKTSSGSLRPRTGCTPSETSGRGQTRAKALENSIGRAKRLVRSSSREARFTAGPITV